jgi:hypothetical protein
VVCSLPLALDFRTSHLVRSHRPRELPGWAADAKRRPLAVDQTASCPVTITLTRVDDDRKEDLGRAARSVAAGRLNPARPRARRWYRHTMGAAERTIGCASYGTSVTIHFSRTFDGRTPTLCGARGIPCPASSEWRYVSCEACLARIVHARRAANDVALCGAPADRGQGTQQRSEVSCEGCRGEIARRMGPHRAAPLR